MNLKRACTSLPVIMLLVTMVQLSCTPESCLEETVTTVNAVFYRTGTGKVEAPDSVTLYGLGMELVKIYNATRGVKVAKMPLDASEDACAFFIKVNGIPDTIYFSYRSYPHLVSKECGFTVYHSLDTVYNKAGGIDVLLTNGSITTSNEENIRIFY